MVTSQFEIYITSWLRAVSPGATRRVTLPVAAYHTRLILGAENVAKNHAIDRCIDGRLGGFTGGNDPITA